MQVVAGRVSEKSGLVSWTLLPACDGQVNPSFLGRRDRRGLQNPVLTAKEIVRRVGKKIGSVAGPNVRNPSQPGDNYGTRIASAAQSSVSRGVKE